MSGEAGWCHEVIACALLALGWRAADPRAADPFAVPAALRTLEHFFKTLTADLRARLESALYDLLLVRDFGPHEVAVRLDAVGAAVRDAGLQGEVRRGCGVRAANRESEIGMTTAFGLIDAAAGRGDVGALLARLHGEHHDLLPGVRDALGGAANDLLVACDHVHAAGYPTRFRDEVQRLDLDPHLVGRWQSDHKPVTPELSAAAALVLARLLDGGRFAAGRFDEVPTLEVSDEYLDLSNDMTTDDVPVADAVTNITSADASKVDAELNKKRGIPQTGADVRVRQYLLDNGRLNPAVSARAMHELSRSTHAEASAEDKA